MADTVGEKGNRGGFAGRVAVDWVAFVASYTRERVLAVGSQETEATGAYTIFWSRSRLELQLVAEFHHLWATLCVFRVRWG